MANFRKQTYAYISQKVKQSQAKKQIIYNYKNALVVLKLHFFKIKCK